MNNPHRKAFRSALLTLIACVLVALTASKSVICQQPTAQPVAPPSSQTQGAQPLVFTVTVTNKKGDYVTGLEKSDFTVLDDKTPRDITYFKGQDEPLSIGFILDVSASMFSRDRLDLMKTLFNEALTRFVQQSNGSNEYFLIGFNERPQLLMDWTGKVTDLNAALQTVGLKEPKARGNQTALYDACYLGVEKLARSSKYPKHAMIVISDGQDNNSHHTFKELRELLRESDVLVYSVGITGDDANSALGLQGQSFLDQFALPTGGVAFFPAKSAEVRTVFVMIADELRHQYSIGFNPASYPGDRDWHRIKIRLVERSNAPRELRNLSARNREGYYLKTNQR